MGRELESFPCYLCGRRLYFQFVMVAARMMQNYFDEGKRIEGEGYHHHHHHHHCRYDSR